MNLIVIVASVLIIITPPVMTLESVVDVLQLVGPFPYPRAPVYG